MTAVSQTKWTKLWGRSGARTYWHDEKSGRITITDGSPPGTSPSCTLGVAAIQNAGYLQGEIVGRRIVFRVPISESEAAVIAEANEAHFVAERCGVVLRIHQPVTGHSYVNTWKLTPIDDPELRTLCLQLCAKWGSGGDENDIMAQIAGVLDVKLPGHPDPEQKRKAAKHGALSAEEPACVRCSWPYAEHGDRAKGEPAEECPYGEPGEKWLGPPPYYDDAAMQAEAADVLDSRQLSFRKYDESRHHLCRPIAPWRAKKALALRRADEEHVATCNPVSTGCTDPVHIAAECAAISAQLSLSRDEKKTIAKAFAAYRRELHVEDVDEALHEYRETEVNDLDCLAAKLVLDPDYYAHDSAPGSAS
jgi:hypothetical protein